MRASRPAGDRARHALWPLALLAGLVPFLATLLAYALSIRLGLVPGCNPLLEGCVSISRAARHDLPNILFRGLVLPAAVLQSMCWLLCPAWLRTLDAAPLRWPRALPVLGAAAGVLLVVYGTFLGTEGEGYRWMRRHGVRWYFVLTCLGMLVLVWQSRDRLGGVPRIAGALRALRAALLVLAAAYLALLLGESDAAALDAAENIAEWWAGVLFTAFFLVLAWAWRRTRFELRLGRGDG